MNQRIYEVVAENEETSLFVCIANSEKEAKRLTLLWIKEFDPSCTEYLEFRIHYYIVGSIGMDCNAISKNVAFDPMNSEGKNIFPPCSNDAETESKKAADSLTVDEIVEYCHTCAETVNKLKQKCLSNNTTGDLAAYAYFDRKSIMYEYEIPRLIKSIMAEKTKSQKMKHYKIYYIDGHDFKYKSFETDAEDKEAAIRNLRDSYTNGDFEHQIKGVIEE